MISDLKKEMNKFIADLEKNIQNKSDLEYIKERIPHLFEVILDEMEKVINIKEEKMNKIMQTQQELEEYNEDSTNKKIEDNMQEVIKQLLKSNQYTKEVINQLINKIEIDKDKHAVIYFNFYELNCLGGNVDVKQASNL